MKNTVLHALRRGFTLVELLIVVIILAVLAAIVIPQFNSATTDTQEAALDANLAAMRNAIELYKAQHANYPGRTASSGGAGCTGAAGTGTANSAQAFIDQMTTYSNAAGQSCTVGSASYKYGPYVRKGIPNEPITQRGRNAAEIAVASAGTPVVPSAATGGWSYDTVTGQFVMNSNANASDGRPYSTR
ncbi:MAG: prepilin-type N-terminal cleavage/methylation domain-containing protein [Ideonella sp.]|nr:prepilin-type N-terminal cleavage/methylation domain-containing protein [Ideonella sp.]